MKIITKDKKQIIEFSKKLEVLYKTFNWTWCSSSETPTAKDIEKHIIDLISKMEKTSMSTSCGGITIEKEEEGYYCIEWRLTESIWLNLR